MAFFFCPAGNFLSEHKYYPFGEGATRPAQNDLPLKFTGHERDFYADGASDDLDYMHARFCDPRVGRFLSVDPVLGSPPTPQNWDRNSYVRGNPMVLIDPSGKKSSLQIKRANAFLKTTFQSSTPNRSTTRT